MTSITLSKQDKPMKKNNHLFMAIVIGWLFVIYEYAVRVSDGVILTHIQQDLGLKASHLGLLSSAYYIAYVAFMIPAGVLIDRFGLYRCWNIAILILASGCLMFGLAIDLPMLVVARVLMGAGSVFSVIGVFAVAVSLPRSGFLLGITMGVAMAGALMGQGPWLHLTIKLGKWQDTYYLACLFGVFLFIWWYLYGKQKSFTLLPSATLSQVWSGFSTLSRSRAFWVLAIFMGCLSAPQTAFMAFWGPRFLESMYHISNTKAAYINSLISVGGLVGAIIIGHMGDRYAVKKLLVCAGLLATLSMMAVLSKWFDSLIMLTLMLLIMGCVTNANVLVFAFLGKKFFHLPRTTVQGTSNMFNMAGGPFFQLLVGLGITIESAGGLIINADHMRQPLATIPLCIFAMTLVLSFTSLYEKKRSYSAS